MRMHAITIFFRAVVVRSFFVLVGASAGGFGRQSIGHGLSFRESQKSVVPNSELRSLRDTYAFAEIAKVVFSLEPHGNRMRILKDSLSSQNAFANVCRVPSISAEVCHKDSVLFNTDAAIGLSHARGWRWQYENKIPVAVFFEDDVDLSKMPPQFDELIQTALEELSQPNGGWDLFRLHYLDKRSYEGWDGGLSGAQVPVRDFSPDFNWTIIGDGACNSYQGNGMYMLTYAGAKLALEGYRPNQAADFWNSFSTVKDKSMNISCYNSNMVNFVDVSSDHRSIEQVAKSLHEHELPRRLDSGIADCEEVSDVDCPDANSILLS